jgi:hypothetical protein
MKFVQVLAGALLACARGTGRLHAFLPVGLGGDS